MKKIESLRAAKPAMSPGAIIESMKGFAHLRTLVVGDLFLDEYIESEMYEVSKEGPIPVVRIRSKTQTPGAAGNLASSIRNLGAAVSVVGVVGKDSNGDVLLSGLGDRGIRTRSVVVHPRMRTLTYSKLRACVANTPSREILRMDILPDGPVARDVEDRILASIRREAAGADAIVVLDQIHHLITKRILQELPGIARSAGALLHGSSRDHIQDFHDFDLITPNDREAHLAVGGDPGDVVRLGTLLKQRGRFRKVLLTLGERGMALASEKGPMLRMETFAKEVVDVTGAGDAVSSVTALGNSLGWDLPSVAWAASHAAAIAIAHVGTHHVSCAEIVERIQSCLGGSHRRRSGA